jgi:hypothetical protein
MMKTKVFVVQIGQPLKSLQIVRVDLNSLVRRISSPAKRLKSTSFSKLDSYVLAALTAPSLLAELFGLTAKSLNKLSY